MEKKKGIIITIIVVLLLLVVGVTYAFFTYESGTKSDIVTGQIYMNYEETSTISLTGVFPETKEQALARTDENGVFEFTITGRNTSKYPVYYEIDLLEGGVITGKTETSTKILPEHVMIYLEKDGVPVIEGETYADFNNRRIYTDTIPANQTSNIEHKYTLRMWIDENVTISDTNPNADYTTTEWNDAYTSLKVRVVGDFEYKDVATEASCFTYISGDEIVLDTSEEKLEACMTNAANMYGQDLSTAQDEYQSFCEGTGTIDIDVVEMTLQEYANVGLSQGATMEDLIQMFPVIVGFEAGDEIEITDYDITCGTDVVIPAYIEGLPVTRITGELYIGSGVEVVGAFDSKGITSVKLPNTLEYIGDNAFRDNDLTEIVIPDNVTRITDFAFGNNSLTTVVLGENVSIIGTYTFAYNDLTQIIIPDNVIEIKNFAFWDNRLTMVFLGKSVSNIGNGAFSLVLNGTTIYNPIERIINKSGNTFNWKNILDASSRVTIQELGVVATGTYVYNDGGVNREIQITSE